MQEPSVARIRRARIPKDTVTLARWLLGKVVVREHRGRLLRGRITETEAYLPGDPACHAFRGITPRNRSLFLPHGHSYVYLCYGVSYLLNVSSEREGVGAGVLLRALEPLGALRGNLRGPGRLTTALKVDLRHDGLDLFGNGPLWIGTDGHEVDVVGTSTRIGLTKAADERLRFFVGGSAHLSGSRALNTLPLPA